MKTIVLSFLILLKTLLFQWHCGHQEWRS